MTETVLLFASFGIFILGMFILIVWARVIDATNLHHHWTTPIQLFALLIGYSVFVGCTMMHLGNTLIQQNIEPKPWQIESAERTNG